MALLTCKAFAAETSGVCGTDVNWTFSDGALTVAGTGPMADYTKNTVPWKAFRDEIRTVSVAAGVTAVGNHAFDWRALRAENSKHTPGGNKITESDVDQLQPGSPHSMF